MKKILLPAIVALLLTSISALYAQESTSKHEPPKTKLEQFVAQDGVVIVQGFTTIGTAKAMNGSVVNVDAKEFFNAS